MRKLFILALFMTAGCGTVRTIQAPPTEKEMEVAFFDPSVIDNLVVRETTKQDVLAKLGKPYIDVPMEDGRLQWIYMLNWERQAILTFSGELLTQVEWSEEYGTPVKMTN